MKSVRYFKALADETRLRILNLTYHHELNVNEIVRILSMGQSRISRHLKILMDNGLVVYRRDGLWMYYSAIKEGDGHKFIQSILFLIEQEDLFLNDIINAKHQIFKRSQRTQLFFDSVADKWEHLKQEIVGNIDLNQKILDALPHLKTAVDLGCGTGDLLPVLLKNAEQVIGVEKSPIMLEAARKHYRKHQPRIDIRIGELEHLPMRDEEADAAVTNMVLHHLPEPCVAIREAHRILKKDGHFLIIELLAHDHDDMREMYGDYWLGFSIENIKIWLNESSFEILRHELFELKKGLQGFIILAKKI